VEEFARGCMRTYLILKEKARLWNENKEIKTLLAEISKSPTEHVGRYSKKGAKALLQKTFDREALARRGLMYERLDQLTMDLLFGVK